MLLELFRGFTRGSGREILAQSIKQGKKLKKIKKKKIVNFTLTHAGFHGARHARSLRCL